LFEILRLLSIEYLLCLEGVAAVLCFMVGSAGVEALLSCHGEVGLAMAGERAAQATLGRRACGAGRRAVGRRAGVGE
jgi:hypothetical protein